MTDPDDDDFDDEEGELVETGGFTVDPKVAAEKLRDFQLADARDFLVPWLRGAAASGAMRVDASTTPNGLEFCFDGKIPPDEILGDLTAGLLHADYGVPGRQLAYGALALHRLAPESVSGDVRDGRTVLAVSWGGKSPASAALSRLAAAFGMHSLELRVEGRVVPDPARASEPVRSFGGARTQCIILESRRMFGSGRIHYYKLAALVETVDFGLSGPFDAFVSNENFELSLSQDRVMKNRRVEKVTQRLMRLRRRLAQWQPPASSGWLGRLRRLFY